MGTTRNTEGGRGRPERQRSPATGGGRPERQRSPATGGGRPERRRLPVTGGGRPERRRSPATVAGLLTALALALCTGPVALAADPGGSHLATGAGAPWLPMGEVASRGFELAGAGGAGGGGVGSPRRPGAILAAPRLASTRLDPPRPRPPEGLAERALERAGRSSAPCTAPPLHLVA
jgi:hypothetical protein